MDCIFCHPDRSILAETKLSFAFLDGFPISKGHTLVIPKRHMPNPVNEGIMQFYIRKVLERHGIWQTISGGKECVHCQTTNNNCRTPTLNLASSQRAMPNYGQGQFLENGTTSEAVSLSFGWQDFLSAYLIDQVFSFEIDEMHSLFVVGQICADPLRHHHDQCAVIHVHPISSTDQFIRRVANEWTVWINCKVRFIITGHRPNTRLNFSRQTTRYLIWHLAPSAKLSSGAYSSPQLRDEPPPALTLR